MAKLSIIYRNDLYEIYYQESSIHRIDKFLGDSQYRRSVSFSDLPEKLQSDILIQITNDED